MHSETIFPQATTPLDCLTDLYTKSLRYQIIGVVSDTTHQLNAVVMTYALDKLDQWIDAHYPRDTTIPRLVIKDQKSIVTRLYGPGYSLNSLDNTLRDRIQSLDTDPLKRPHSIIIEQCDAQCSAAFYDRIDHLQNIMPEHVTLILHTQSRSALSADLPTCSMS